MDRPSKEALVRYFQGRSLPAEVSLIDLYLAMDIDEEYIISCLKDAWLSTGEFDYDQGSDNDLENFKQRFHQKKDLISPQKLLSGNGESGEEDSTAVSIPQKSTRRMHIGIWTKVAAASLLIIGSFAFAIYKQRQKVEDLETTAGVVDILPGKSKASLTLDDGTVISLNDLDNGEVLTQNGLRIEKTDDGEIVYHSLDVGNSKAIMYNTITTPKGGQFRVVLPDGSQTWLNAASSLTYPVNFSSAERRVKMTGEIYFDIAKSNVKTKNGTKRIPFYVETGDHEIQVLGTQFNVNAYVDEPYSKTTLIEGSVRLTDARSGNSILLSPGQQAIHNKQLSVSLANIDEEMAWKSGDFVFNNEELQSVLRKISRWYDVEIDCAPNLAKVKLTGMVSRQQPLSAMITSISALGTLNMKIKEGRIIVTE